MEYLNILIGIAIGLLIGWLIHNLIRQKEKVIPYIEYEKIKIDNNNLISDNKVLISQIESFSETKKDVDGKINEIINLNKQISSLSTENKNLENKLYEQKKELTDLQVLFKDEFDNLASKILEEKSKKFTELNKDNLNLILNPLQENIKEFKQKVEDVYINEGKERYSLKNEIKNLIDANQKISQEASNLTKALKGEVKTQGIWGEIILERILEQSGLVADREYFIQQSYSSDDGKRLQPDVIIVFPGDRNVIIDSKVSLTAYEKYCSAETNEQQDLLLRQHITSVKKHINELSIKRYQEIYKIKTLDFVLMFMPVEPAFNIALQNDPDLWNYAFERNIFIISPTNLIFILKMAENLWRREYQTKNVIEIAKKSGEMYDKFVGVLNDLIELGKKLNATQVYYKDAMSKFYEGKGNLIKRAEDIRSLGAEATKQMPQLFLEKMEKD